MSNLQHADRDLALVRTFRAAFAALDDLRGKQPDAAARIADIVASHMRSAHPMASIPALAVTEPVAAIGVGLSAIERELSDGQRYRIESIDGICCMHAVDDEARVVLAFAKAPLDVFIEDVRSVGVYQCR